MLRAAVLTATCCLLILVLMGSSSWDGTKTAERGKPTLGLTPKGVGKHQRSDKCNKWSIVKGIRFYRASTWMWQWQEGVRYERFTKWRPKHSCGFLSYLGKAARKKALVARRSFESWYSRTYAKWDCIHRHEAAWHGDNNPTYDGGLQMDSGFQNTYGSEFVRLWGNASNWPIWAQLRAAERAYSGYNGYGARYFGPWPTRSYCGL